MMSTLFSWRNKHGVEVFEVVSILTTIVITMLTVARSTVCEHVGFSCLCWFKFFFLTSWTCSLTILWTQSPHAIKWGWEIYPPWSYLIWSSLLIMLRSMFSTKTKFLLFFPPGPSQQGHRLCKGMRVLSRVPAAGSPTDSPTELDAAAWKRISPNLALLLQTPSLVGLSIPDIFHTSDSEELNSISGLSWDGQPSGEHNF